jgi:hypothetical protein
MKPVAEFKEDLAKVFELLRFRPIQLCMFLKVLIGSEDGMDDDFRDCYCET